ncbi:hypothetical protein FB45DRAFT_1056664 [Roridomyces roridus]|uniref:Uncharacterized protein n=1 Tax=Roridomyces roridus TaxID=1738132 RepID=A0AAD7BZ20_9AGAR|nr:hypothetical protein FB45DRAFT_1056664 [Roridomyces roridus]
MLRLGTAPFLLSILALFFLFSGLHVQAHPTPPQISRRNPSTDGPAMLTASWIWAADTNGAAITTPGNVAFLRRFTAPTGKLASTAVISMTAVDNFYLWVNGQPIGASSPQPDQWKTAQVFTAALNATTENDFSVLVANSGDSAEPEAGLLAAITIFYSDGTNTTLVSDNEWLASSTIPSNFPYPSTFPAAAVIAPYGSGPWGQNVIVPLPGPSTLNLSASTWIWSVAAGLVGFRRTISTPTGKSAQSATILLTVDNSFLLYLNGQYVGAPPNIGALQIWQTAQRFNVTLNPTVNIFTVQARNDVQAGTTTQTSAGFIAAIQVFYADGSSDIIRTDSSWLNSPGDFTDVGTFLNTADTLLSNSTELGLYGLAPWNGVNVADALDNANVPQAPFGGTTTPASSSPSSTSSTSSSHPRDVPIAAILGSVLGAVVLVALVVIAILWRRRHRNSLGALNERTAARSFDALLSTSEHAAATPVAFNSAAPPSSSLAAASHSASASGSAGPSSDTLPQPRPITAAHRRKADEAMVQRMNGGAGVADVAYAEELAPPPRYSVRN